jgi:hypothetical protein
MNGTYIFHTEEVERIEKEQNKLGFTTKEIIAYLEGLNIKVSPYFHLSSSIPISIIDCKQNHVFGYRIRLSVHTRREGSHVTFQ